VIRLRSVAIVALAAAACGGLSPSAGDGGSGPTASATRYHVEQGVIVATPAAQAALDERYREGAVVLVPALTPIEP
jgi:hypothetical protein